MLVYRVAVPNLEAISAFQVKAALDAIVGHFECHSDVEDVLDALSIMCRVHYLPDDDALTGVIMTGKPFVHLLFSRLALWPGRIFHSQQRKVLRP